MTPYKNFISSAQTFFSTNAFLKFLLTAQIFIFAFGSLFFLLGLFILQVYEAFICIGSILIWAGLLLSIIKNDMLTIVIASGTIALGSLVGWIISLAGSAYYGYSVGGVFMFTPFFYFLAFGAVTIVVAIKSEKFRGMRAASAVKTMGVACQNCGAVVPANAAFCPNCGAKKPEPQYAPPQQAYAPPPPSAQPAYAPPPVQPAEPAQPAPEPEQPEKPEGKKCLNCGMELPLDAAFCGKCGSKQ